jgi:tetratricopeptide (TPR) repeat protein
MLLSASILIDQGEHNRAGEVLAQVRSMAGRHSLRDLEAQALCLLGKVRAEQEGYEEAIALCTEGIDLANRLGHAVFECRAICAEVSVAAGDSEKALEFLGSALDDAAIVYRDKCPPRMRHSLMEAKKVPTYVREIEDILIGLGRTDEAATYRAKFPLK